jgi:predicted amidophosphoribosyltransferase
MITEPAKWPQYYDDLEVKVFAPNYYVPLPKRDTYSANIVFGKSQDKSSYFLAEVLRVFQHLPFTPDLIVTVPSSKLNDYSVTMLELGKRLSKILGIKNKNIIKRTKTIRKQTDCNDYDQRHSAVDGVFKVTKHLDGEKVVIMDDTRTSGMTILECAKMLKEAGASKIIAVCLGITGEKT